LLPDQPPEAVQLVAFVEVQDSVAVVPERTADTLALSVTVGAGTCTVMLATACAVPPAPLHSRVNLAF
jgi:hypothetical protein